MSVQYVVRYSLLHLSISTRIRKVLKYVHTPVLVSQEVCSSRSRRIIMAVALSIVGLLLAVIGLGFSILVAIANVGITMEEFYD